MKTAPQKLSRKDAPTGARLVANVQRRAKNHKFVTKIGMLAADMGRSVRDGEATVSDCIYAFEIIKDWSGFLDARRSPVDPRYGGKVK